MEIFISTIAAQQTPSFKYYADAERRGKLITQWFSWFPVMVLGIFIVSACDACWNIFFVGNMDSTTYYVPFNLFIPFVSDQTITGFVVILLSAMFGAYCYGLAMTATIMNFVCCCFYTDACCRQFKQILDEVNGMLSTGHNRNVRKSIEIKKHLITAVTLHIKILE